MGNKTLLGTVAMIALVPALAHAQVGSAGPPAASASTPPPSSTTSSSVSTPNTPRTTASPEAANTTTVGEIMVTAQRRSEKLSDVPLSVVAQTADQLQQAGVVDTRGIQQISPGLTFTTQGAWAEPNLRGVSTGSSGAGEESPIAIYVDGVYQVNQVSSLFNLPDVQQLEVLKGPQGTLFGRNAEGGAINITTKEPSFVATGDVTATYGYYTGSGGSETSGDYSIKGFLAGPLIGDKLAGSLSFLYGKTDGYLHNLDNGGRDGSINDKMFRAKLLFEPTPNIKFLAAGWFGKDFDNANTAPTALGGNSVVNAINPVTGTPFYPGGIVASQPWTTAHDFPTYINSETYGASLRGTFDFDAGTLTSLTAYNRARNEVRVDVSSGFLPEPERTQCYSSFACIDYQVKQLALSESEELVFTSRKHGPFSFVGGVFAFRSDEHSGADINADVLPGVFNNDSRVVTYSYAAFAEGNYDFTPRLTLILGGRVSYEKKDGSFAAVTGTTYVPTNASSWTSFTPRASLRYRLDDQSNVYFTFSQGFKSGVINPSAPFNVVAPENLTAFEVGYKRNTEFYSIAASAFYYDYKDLQVQSFTGTSTVTTNAASATIYGVDLDGSVRLSHDLSLRLAVSYLPTARYDRYEGITYYAPPLGAFGLTSYPPTTVPPTLLNANGRRILKTPDVTATLSANYNKQLPFGTLDASASVYYSDAFYWELGYRVKTDAHEVVNAQVSLTPTNSKFTFTLWAKNLANTPYVEGVVESASSDMGVYAPPREIGASLGLKF